jgi:hypothetical protein
MDEVFRARGYVKNVELVEAGGDWSTYWYNGHIYESDIRRGLLVWGLSDPAVAVAKKPDHLIVMGLILSLRMKTPLGKRLMLVYLTGRKSGKQYKQPISYVRDGDALLTPGGGKWKLNLVEGRPERVRLNGDEVFLRPELVRDPEEVDRLLGVMSSKNKMTERLPAYTRTPMDTTTATASTSCSSTTSASSAGDQMSPQRRCQPQEEATATPCHRVVPTLGLLLS